MIEIGVMGGGSLAMWSTYFGTGCKIIGIDIEPSCKQHESENVEVFIGNQDDPALIETILAEYPEIDVVLDDGSHHSKHMMKSFGLIYKHVLPYGVYLVEDTHANYWDDWEGGLHRADMFMKFSKAKTDELNAVHTRGALQPTDFTPTTDSITCYDSVVAFEKRPQGLRQAPNHRRYECPSLIDRWLATFALSASARPA